MAFLVEHRGLGGPAQSDANAVEQRPLQERSKSSGKMKLASAFRRGSTPVGISRSPPSSRRTSTVEAERRPSLVTIPSRLRRRKTAKSADEWNEEDEQAASQLGQLFFGLPSEILTSIISYLNIQDIYCLRQASRATSTILDHNASTVTRSVLSKIVPEECLVHVYTLYPIPSQSPSLAHLLQISHCQSIIDRTIYHTLSFIQMRLYMLTQQSQTTNSASLIGSNREKLITALQKPAWTVYHFLESFRDTITTTHDSNHDTSVGRFWTCSLCKEAITDLTNTYPRTSLMGAYHFYQLLITHLRSATRAPTYAGTIERKLRGWGKNPASDDDLSILVVLGGLELLSKISMMQGSYDTRLKTVSTFVDKVKYHVDVNTNLRAPNSEPLRQTDEDLDLTESLSPAYDILKQEHLDRVPGLSEFFFPVWEERIVREGLAESEHDLESPFGWVQRIINGEDGESAPASSGGGATVTTTVMPGPQPVYYLGAPTI